MSDNMVLIMDLKTYARKLRLHNTKQWDDQ